MRKAKVLVAAGIAAVISASSAAGHSGEQRTKKDQLGKVHFATSCDPKVEERFDHAMTLLHSFWAKDAIDGFSDVAREDPNCAMAYWGMAMARQQNPLTGQEPRPEQIQDALIELDQAKAIGAKTQREHDYLAAIDLIYRDADKTDFKTRRLAYKEAMEKLSQRYPEDTEATIFYALALNMTAQLTDKTYQNQLKAAEILENMLKRQPYHPGVAHYLIHSYDYPAIAGRGLSSARLYTKLAPSHPHALHMPSHIFTRLGMWQESIDANVRSAAAAKAEGNGQEQAHAMDYLVHAYLQLAEDSEAKKVVDESVSVKVNPAVFIGHYALAAMPARYVIERRAWTEARNLQVRNTPFLFPDAITHFARGIGFARSGDVESANKEALKLAQLRDGLAEKQNTYWSKQVDVQRLAVEAWAALARGAQDEALKLMRAAADLEDSMEKHIVTPSPIIPARELFGEMLLQLKQPAEALQAFEASAQREPNRYRGVYGAALSAEQTKDRNKARANYTKFIALNKTGAHTRPELAMAKAYLAQR